MSDRDGADGITPVGDPTDPTALQALHPLATSEVEVAPTLVHREVYTTRGLLSVFWHRPPVDDLAPRGAAVVACGGARDIKDVRRAINEAGCAAVAAGSMFIYQAQNRGVLISYPTPETIQSELFDRT